MDPALLPAAVLAALSLAHEDPEVYCDWPPGPDYMYEERDERKILKPAQVSICLSFIDVEATLEPPPRTSTPSLPELMLLRDGFEDLMSESTPTSFAPTIEEEHEGPWPSGAPHPALDAEIEAEDPELQLPLDAARGLRLRRLRRAHQRQVEQRVARQDAIQALEQQGRLPEDVLAQLRADERA